MAVAEVHCAAALAGYADIFPHDAPKPTPESLVPEWRELIVTADTTVFVALAETRVIGVAALAPDVDVPAGLLLKRLYVDPSGWGHGIGAALHDRVLAEATGWGATTIDLWVLEANHRARAMYERRGWRHIPGLTAEVAAPSIVDVLYERPL